MEDITKQSIDKRARSTEQTADQLRWLRSIDTHFHDETHEYFWVKSEEEYQEVARLLGHEKIASDQIIGYTYQATANEPLELHSDELLFEGKLNVAQIQNIIADAGINLEFVNCFDTTLVVAIDAESMAAYRFRLNSWGVVCEDCLHTENPSLREELAMNEGSGHGCGHVDDEYNFSFGVEILIRREFAEYLKGVGNDW